MNKKGFFLLDFLIAISIYSFFIITITTCFQIYAKNFDKDKKFLNDFEQTQNNIEKFLADEIVTVNIKIEPYFKNINKVTFLVNQNKKIELLYEKR